MKLWDYDTGLTMGVGGGHSGAINGVAIAPDQKTIVSVGSEGGIFIWGVPEDAAGKMEDMSLLE